MSSVNVYMCDYKIAVLLTKEADSLQAQSELATHFADTLLKDNIRSTTGRFIVNLLRVNL